MAEGASTADEAVATGASTTDEVAVKVASTTDKAVAEGAFTADEAVAEGTSTDVVLAKGASAVEEAMAKVASMADNVVAESALTADEAVAEGVSTADEVLAKGASTVEEVTVKVTSTADEAMAKVASTEEEETPADSMSLSDPPTDGGSAAPAHTHSPRALPSLPGRQVFAYAGDSVEGAIRDLPAPVHGETCAVQALTSANDVTVAGGGIADLDGDACHDVAVPVGDVVTTTLAFAEEFSVPCVDVDPTANPETGEVDRLTVKLQFCTAYRTLDADASCDAAGPSPGAPAACRCDTVDLRVEVLGEEHAVPTCSPHAPDDEGHEEVGPVPEFEVPTASPIEVTVGASPVSAAWGRRDRDPVRRPEGGTL